ncbi:hypothetical protein PR003_g24855 [Phytophthora rubi]|uniref:Uncharacterized protein n=1 Tax=Phytophthora rubi TaxID=129364 RepID=A0A6A4CKM8_9STRA|nr:hypothetical protein PR003_g24855 [Phytophthora rubi]
MSRLTPTCDSAFTSSIVGVRPWRIESMTQGGEMSSTCRQERLHRVQDALQVGDAVLQRHELRHVGPVLQHGGVGAQEHEVSTYLLLVLRGLEFLVEEEICSKLQVESVEICSVQENPRPPYMQVMQGQAAVGKLILRTKSSAAEVQELRSVQATLALLAKSDEIDTESDAGVKQIRHILTLHRHRIPPIRLEMMLFLKVNRCFWGATATVSKAA